MGVSAIRRPHPFGIDTYILKSFSRDLSHYFSLYATNPNGGYINGMQIQQIPEPSSFTLFALAALLYCLVVRRQQKGVSKKGSDDMKAFCSLALRSF